MLQNKKEQVYEILKKRILHREYQLGEHLNIGQLSTEMGVSNSPVREALSLLEKEGLILNTANSGPSVVTLSKGDKFEIAQLLFFLTSGAYRFVIHVGNAKMISNCMRQAFTLQREAYEAKDAYQFVYQSCLFDRCIVAAAKNSRLMSQYDVMFPLFFLVTLYELDQEPEEWLSALSRHEQILEAIEKERHDDVVDLLAVYYYRDAWGGFLGL